MLTYSAIDLFTLCLEGEMGQVKRTLLIAEGTDALAGKTVIALLLVKNVRLSAAKFRSYMMARTC